MRTKKEYSFDEKKLAENIISTGFPNGAIDYGEMYLIAKYFRETLKYGAVRLEKEIIKFCKNQNKAFNPVVESASIKKWVKYAMNYNLRKVNSVTISETEIAFLKGIKDEKHRKILYSTLVFAKASKTGSTYRKMEEKEKTDNYYVHYGNFLDIVRISKVKGVSELNLADIYFKYKDVLFLYNPEKQLMKINYVSEGEGVEIKIDNPDSIMDEYEAIFGGQKCSICGKPIIKNSNRQRTCSDCSKTLEKQRKARWRNKQKDV